MTGSKFKNGLEIAIVPPELMPYFIHLSKIEIAPRVVSVKGSEALTERVNGSRLNEMLRTESIDSLAQIYGNVGKQIAYMKKIGVNHGDLKPDNIVVEGMKPFIIDWSEMWVKNGNTIPNVPDHVLFGIETRVELTKANRFEIYTQLIESAVDAHNEELKIPRMTCDADIFTKALEEFGQENFMDFILSKFNTH